MMITIMATRITMEDHQWIDNAEDLERWDLHQPDTTIDLSILAQATERQNRGHLEEVVPNHLVVQQEVGHITQQET
jgi:hypothetical protein